MSLSRAFAGIRVLDLSQNLPGPLATAMLAAAGAEVIKVEPPWGDPARPFGALFERVNAGKKSLILDLREPAERAILEALVAAADVLVESFRPGVMAGFGFSAKLVCAENPRLIWCSISGWGQDLAAPPAHDLNLQAASGLSALLGAAEEQPRAISLPVADLSAAHTATAAIATALFARERSGRGCCLDLALADTVAAWSRLWSEAMEHRRRLLGESLESVQGWLSSGGGGLRSGLAAVLGHEAVDGLARRLDDGIGRSRIADRVRRLGLFALPHYGLFATADGRYLALAIVDEPHFWKRLCEVLELDALGSLPLAARVLAGRPIREALKRGLAARGLEELLTSLAGLPVSPVATEGAEDYPPLAARLPQGVASKPFDLELAPLAALGGDRDEILESWLNA